MTAVQTSVQPENETEEMLSRYLEEDLDAEERAAVEVLLQERPEVRAELESLRQTLALMQRMPTLEAPPDFVQKVKRKVRRQRRLRVDQQHQFRMPYEILGVIVVILMFVLYMLVQQHSEKKNEKSLKAPTTRTQSKSSPSPQPKAATRPAP